MVRYRADEMRWLFVSCFPPSAFVPSYFQCWCGDGYDMYGKSSRCTMPCSGDDRKECGGRDALSVYKAYKSG